MHSFICADKIDGQLVLFEVYKVVCQFAVTGSLRALLRRLSAGVDIVKYIRRDLLKCQITSCARMRDIFVIINLPVNL